MNLEIPAVIANMSKPLQQSIGVTVVAWLISCGILFFCIVPKKNHYTVAYKHMLETTAIRDSMKLDIAKINEQHEATLRLQKERDTFLSDHALEPLLGSLAMRAKSVLSFVSQQTGFIIDNVKELPAMALRVPTPTAQQLYSRQPVEFYGHGSYVQIMDFIAQTEKHYPYVVLSGLTILAQVQSPEVHKAVITFEWPVKGEKRQALATGKTN